MSLQLFTRYPADVVEHRKFGAHLALLMPPLAALLYPFLLEALHANITPVISRQSAEPALRSAAAALSLLLAFAAPIVALLGAMTLWELAAPTVTQRRARTIALLTVLGPVAASNEQGIQRLAEWRERSRCERHPSRGCNSFAALRHDPEEIGLGPSDASDEIVEHLNRPGDI